MKFVLLVTHSTPQLQNTIASFDLASIKPEILCWNEKWKGWKWRIEKYLHFCNAIIESNEKDGKGEAEVIAFIDAFDVLCLRKDIYPNFEKTFESFNSDIVFSSEWWCGSSSNCGYTSRFSNEKSCLLIERDLDVSVKGNHNLNVGFVCGNVRSLAKMYSDVLNRANSESFDDQKAISQWVDSDLSSSIRLSLDRQGLLCKTVNVFDTALKRNNIQTAPFFAHFPGPMLKIGLFPHYNLNAASILGQNANLKDLYSFLYALFCILIISFIIS